MEKRKKKKIFIVALIFTIIILLIAMVSLYIAEERFRNVIDTYIFKRNITDENIATIDLNTDKNNQIHVYSKYIAILNNQKVTLYNSYGEKLTDIDVNINTAIFDSSEKYFAIAENGGKELYLILDKNYLWSNKVEGDILQVHVNRNGYVAVVTKDTIYKSILTLYNSDGTLLFKRYFASTRIVDASISADNKSVAIGEVDSSGAMIKSSVKILSVDNAKNDPDNAITNTYNAEEGKLLTNVKYQSKGQIACMYDDSINVIQNEQEKELLKINNKQVTFMSVDLNNSSVHIEEEMTGVFKTNSHVKITNTQNGEENSYNINDVPKEMYAKDNIIAVNTGTEVYFLNANGWLVKKYTTRQEVTNIMFSNNLAGLVYKDKIVIINL